MRNIRRCISEVPDSRNFYLVDANFLVNKRINEKLIQDKGEKSRIRRAKEYWKIIDRQLQEDKARVYVLDLCIAEAFKVLAKKYYNGEKIFKNHASYNYAKKKLQEDLHLTSKEARSSARVVKYHDIQTNRDIIISVDRFFEKACKFERERSRKKIPGGVSLIDLLILACAKYLTDFYGIGQKELFIITQDEPLYDLALSYADLPAVFNPSRPKDAAAKVFV